MKHQRFIDGLRAVAVVPVILFHFNLAHVTGGYVGVDVFFVISGFLITGLIFEQVKAGRFSIIHFYERRARRILPALFVTCLISTALALLLYMPNDFIQFSRSLEGIAIFSSNFIFARWIGYFSDFSSTRPLLHTWSLAVEEQFYLLFPLLLMVLNKHFKEKIHTVRIMIYAPFLLSLVMSIAFIASNPDRTFYLLHTRAWELLAGSILALHLKDVRLSRPAAEAMSAAGAAILLLCFFIYDRNTVFPGIAALPPCIAAVFLLWPNINHETFLKRFLSGAPCVGTGLISYGLYLYHWPVIVFTRYYFDRDPSTVEALGLISLTFILATLSYFIIEQPVRAGRILKRKALFSLSGAGLLAFGLIGLAGLHTSGFPLRFNSDVLQYAITKDDPDHNKVDCSTQLSPQLDKERICKFGALEKSPPDFLLWGDSHAAALQAAVVAQAAKNNIAGWAITRSGCPALTGAERADNFVTYSCPAISAAALDVVKRNKIRNVLLVTRWDMYALGWEKGSVETVREPFISFISKEGKFLTRQDAFAAAFKETVEKLDALGVNVWVVKQVPPQLVDVPSALAKAIYLGRDPEKLKRSYDSIASRRGVIENVFNDTAKTYPLHLIDPMNKFCTQRGGCLLTYKGRALYMDNSHLSSYGALWSQDMLEPFFKSIPQKK